MKKLLLTSMIFCTLTLTSSSVVFAVPFGFIAPTNEGSRNFTPLMQYEFEKQETLDFKNNPEEYKQRREKKEKYLDYQEGKVDVPQSVKTQYNMQNSGPGTSNLQFIKGDDGQIKIKGF